MPDASGCLVQRSVEQQLLPAFESLSSFFSGWLGCCLLVCFAYLLCLLACFLPALTVLTTKSKLCPKKSLFVRQREIQLAIPEQ